MATSVHQSSNGGASKVERFDVVVVGGGAGGAAAAIASAKLGAKTLLVERYGFLGGAAANAQILSYCGFYTPHDTHQRTIGGVGWEIVSELQTLGFDTSPVRSKSGNWIIMLDVEAIKYAFDRRVVDAGVDVRLHTRMVDVERVDRSLAAITLADHSGLHRVEAHAFVDASGEATLSAFAGAELQGGDRGVVQPASLPMVIDGVPLGVTLDREHIGELISQHNQRATLPIERLDGGALMRLPASGNVWWMVVDVATDGVTSRDLSRAEIEARHQAWSLISMLRRHPGFERAHLASTGPQLGIRESRRPRSRHDVTGDDAHTGRRYANAIARASWPMEIHDAPGRTRYLSIGGEGFFDIPHGAVEAESLDNVWLAGRVVGSDKEAYGSIRVMGTAFATGHAAGVCAALWADGHVRDSASVRNALEGQDAII
ncbi:FAD-dependent oxidoreductase [Paraburkholderia sp. SIMBA_053]